MKYRPGTCGDCGATYKLPTSFTKDKAKCKQCGGVVTVGAAVEAAPASQEEFVEHKPSGKKGEGPSMKERLMAARAAAEQEAAPKRKPAGAKPAAKPAAKAGKRPAPVRRARAGSSDGDEAPKRPSRRGAGASSRSSARRAGRGRDKAGDDTDEEEGGGRRRSSQKKSPVMGLVATLLIVIGLGALAFWKFAGDDSTVEAGQGDEQVADVGSGEAGDPGEGDASDGAPANDDAGSTDGSNDEADASNGAADDGAADDGSTDAEGATPDPAPAPSNEVVEVTDPADLPRKDSGMYKIVLANRAGKDAYNERIKKKYPDALYDVNDAAEVNLASLEAFGAYEGTDPETWDEIVDKVAKMCDPEAGVHGTRAQRAIEETFEPQQVVPALINAMCQLDYVENARTAEQCLQTLGKVVKRRFGWSYSPDEPNKVAIANRRSVAAIHDIWTRILSGDKAWEDWYYPAKKETEGDREAVDELGDG